MERNFLFVFLVLTIGSLFGQDSSQTFLSLRNTGVEEFQNQFPEYDGRGTIILILDTGVDMGVEGLTYTSTGEVKVIDVQDFTGQGDIPFYSAEIEEEDDKLFLVNEEKEMIIGCLDDLTLKSIDNEYYIGVIEEELWKNSGSKAADINGNGSNNDQFYFIVFETKKNNEQFWVVYIDTDSDGSLKNENPIRNYKENYDSFFFPNELDLPKFTLGLNIFPDDEYVSFYFDDGSHGTHCAGIAAGNRIGENELYGVAPGAKIMGIKLGNNNLSGGATVAESMKKSYLYADKISREREEPCIINMSFGIGSEIEGHSEIEYFLEELVKNNPYLYIATSNGNEGPGLSTSGMPSASKAIFSSGAVLAEEVGNDLYGTTLKEDIILHFSSRGGEVSKPDVVAPGACVSTVPNFSKGDRFWGTSMASPYSAGVMAVLLGAAKVEYPDIQISSQFLYKVLRESAKPLNGYSYIDQGGGLIRIEEAYQLLKKYIDSGELNKFETYSISSLAPNMLSYSAPNLYIRDASYLCGTETFQFKLKRNKFNKTEKFYRIFNLKSSADWLKVIPKKVYIRNNQTASVKVQFDESILKKPGLYFAQIYGTRADKTKMPEFNLMSTIVVPYEFNTQNDYSISLSNEKLNPGMHKRYFLKIPHGTSNLKIKINSRKMDFTSVRYYLHDSAGRVQLSGNLSAESEVMHKTVNYNNPQPGVHEFVILGQFTSVKESIFGVEFEIDGLNIVGHSIINDKLNVVNYFSKAKTYELSSELLGYQKSYNVEISDFKTYEIPFSLNVGETKKTFKISLQKEEFNKVTDFALMIYDKNGIAKKTAGVSYKDASITLKRTDFESFEEYRCVLIPGFANSPSDILFNITEKTYFNEPIKMDVRFNNSNKLKIYPDIKYEINFTYEDPKNTIPIGTKYFSELTFVSSKTNDAELKKIISINK